MLCLLITDVRETFERIVIAVAAVEQPPRQNALFGIFMPSFVTRSCWLNSSAF